MEGSSNLDMGSGGGDTWRPAIGFPLGSALLMLAIICLAGTFSCCYNWNKIKTIFLCGRGSTDPATTLTSVSVPSSFKPSPVHEESKFRGSLSLPVLMPGDRIPKYIAWPCQPSPRAPPMLEKISVQGNQ